MSTFLGNKLVTRELGIQLQFLAILGFTAFGWYGFVHLRGGAHLGLAELFGRLALYWFLPFLFFCAFKVSVTYFQNRDRKTTESLVSIKEELRTSLIYSIFGTLSVYLSFLLLLFEFSPPGISININELWLSLRPMFYEWIIGFNLLGILRFGLIVINKNGRFKLSS
jgi:hypothetical protein